MNSSVGVNENRAANVATRTRSMATLTERCPMNDQFLEFYALQAISQHDELLCEYTCMEQTGNLQAIAPPCLGRSSNTAIEEAPITAGGAPRFEPIELYSTEGGDPSFPQAIQENI